MEWPAMTLAHLAVLLSALIGADITIQPSRGDRTFASFQRSLAGLDRPSERTLETLKRYDLDRRYRKDVDGALRASRRSPAAGPTPSSCTRWPSCRGSRGQADRWRKARAIDRFVDAVAYAHDFLFDPELADGRGRPTRGSAWPATCTTAASSG